MAKITTGNFMDNSPDNPFRNRVKIYQQRPELWYEERWGGDPKTLKWSLYPEYENHKWDGTKDPLFMAWRAIAAHRWPAVESCTGAGKCLGKGTKIQMYDGSVKVVEDVVVGDVLMGHDGTPRTVLNTNTGTEEMFHVKSSGSSEGFICNRSHILSLVDVKPKSSSDLIDISVDDCLKLDPKILNNLRLVQVGFNVSEDFITETLDDDPYDAGFSLVIETRDSVDIDYYEQFIINTEENRYKFLSGIFDGLHSLERAAVVSDTNNKNRVYTQVGFKQSELMQILLRTGRSLGIRMRYYLDPMLADVFRIGWVGSLNNLSCKRYDFSTYIVSRQAGPTHLSKFELNSLGPGTYYGFTLKEDPHFLLGDGTITHNTYMLKLIIYWYLDCFPNCIIITLATKFDQLKKTLWKEIYKDWPKFQQLRPEAEYFNKPKITMKLPVLDDKGNVVKGEWDVREASATTAHAGKDEEVAQGGAGDHGENMLIILDEASGIAMPILRAYENTCTDPKNVLCLFGNPKTQLDALHQFRLKPNTIGITVSGLDHPNTVCDTTDFSFLLDEETATKYDMQELRESIKRGETDIKIPGAVSPKRIVDSLEEYGPDHPMFLRLVRGRSPESSISSIIKANLVKDVHNHKPDLNIECPYFVGVDVARSMKGDEACVCIIKDHQVIYIRSFQCPDASAIALNLYYSGQELEAKLSEYADDVNRFYDLPNLRELNVNPYDVAIDSVGVGVSTLECFHSPPLNYSVCGVAGSQSYIDELIPQQVKKERPLFRFARLKAQMVWLAERSFRKKTIGIKIGSDGVSEADAKDLRLGLSSFKQSTNDRVRYYDLKPKKEMSKSPNKADAFLLAELMRQCYMAGVPATVFDIGGGKNYIGVHF